MTILMTILCVFVKFYCCSICFNYIFFYSPLFFVVVITIRPWTTTTTTKSLSFSFDFSTIVAVKISMKNKKIKIYWLDWMNVLFCSFLLWPVFFISILAQNKTVFFRTKISRKKTPEAMKIFVPCVCVCFVFL